MLLFDQAPFTDRNTFGQFLNGLGLTGMAVEIGTHRGEFAERLLRHWHGRKLFCVDPWTAGYDPQDYVSNNDRGDDYQQTIRALARHSMRVQIMQTASRMASRSFSEGSLDFVYIDGCHQYESVKEDLALWWPKLRPGGVLAGHDIICPGEVKGGWGQYIQPAVFEFAQAHQRTVYYVLEIPAGPWSYYMVKL